MALIIVDNDCFKAKSRPTTVSLIKDRVDFINDGSLEDHHFTNTESNFRNFFYNAVPKIKVAVVNEVGQSMIDGAPTTQNWSLFPIENEVPAFLPSKKAF